MSAILLRYEKSKIRKKRSVKKKYRGGECGNERIVGGGGGGQGERVEKR